MERILTLIILSLLWCNVGFAAEREPGTDKKCLYVFERENIFERKFLPKVNKDKGIFVTYVGCNKYYDDWSWEYSFDSNIDAAHNNAYYRCKTNEIPKYNLTGCHLFSIDDVIVWGKDAAFVAKIEKEAKAKLITKIAKKQSKNKAETEQELKEIPNSDINKHLQIFKFKKFLFIDRYNNKIVFRKNDPSTLKKITFKKKSNIRTEFAVGVWKDNRWYLRYVPKNFKSFSFIAEYEDNIKTKIFIEYNKDLIKNEATEENEKKIAEKKAKYFAKIFGQMPHFLKKYNNKIFIHRYNGKGKDLESAWAPWNKKEFHLTETKCGDNYYLEQAYTAEIFYHKCASTMLHELAHVVKRYTKVINPSKWVKAKNSDKHFCSRYAMTNDEEDFAESMMCWVGAKYKSNRISKKDAVVIKKFMKNRIKFFDELNLNVYPLK